MEKEQNFNYRIFSKIFATNTSQLLVLNFNKEVHNRGFNSARSAYDIALMDEFIRRGIDISAIYDGQVIDFKHEITLDETGKKVIVKG